MRTIRVCAVGLLALAGVACGGDDDDADGAEPAAAEDDGGGAADDGVGASGGSDDLIDAILRNVFGLSGDVLDDRERECMNDGLAPVFPDGVPDDIELTEELADTIDAVAEDCSAEIGL